MSRLSRMDLSPTHPDTILDQNTFAVNTALDEHAPAAILCGYPCPSFAVKMRTFGYGLEIHRQIYVDVKRSVQRRSTICIIHDVSPSLLLHVRCCGLFPHLMYNT